MSCAKTCHHYVKINMLIHGFDVEAGLSLVGHAAEAKRDTLLKSWNNIEGAAEFP